VLEVREEHVTLWLRIFGDRGPRQILHQLQHGVGVARLSLPDAHGIER
jgi:hypothetical protein